jgi:hypothetical protein
VSRQTGNSGLLPCLKIDSQVRKKQNGEICNLFVILEYNNLILSYIVQVFGGDVESKLKDLHYRYKILIPVSFRKLRRNCWLKPWRFHSCCVSLIIRKTQLYFSDGRVCLPQLFCPGRRSEKAMHGDCRLDACTKELYVHVHYCWLTRKVIGVRCCRQFTRLVLSFRVVGPGGQLQSEPY